MTTLSDNPLGDFLRACRLRLDPAAFGFATGRRRTSGLRREEVAQLANISPTWYTWLEQGRGGAPSREVLDRITVGLRLTAPEREHVWILAFGHPPETRAAGSGAISPRLQRVLDSMATPAIVRTAAWDVVAWNRPATLVLRDYGTLAPEKRNILRMLFTDPEARNVQADWHGVARLLVNAFRADAARLGASEEIDALVRELTQASAEFDEFWRSNDVAGYEGGLKHLNHPHLGPITLEFSSFLVEGRADLMMMVFNQTN
ncbi:helix-turn-helix transcriptional regulator [Pseudomonas antarctica]|uniref:helix-turn-helix transcriptional regulator n=1 Tax=Pseudomonas antarctica TaxID=219572 RepID=UPI003F74E393